MNFVISFIIANLVIVVLGYLVTGLVFTFIHSSFIKNKEYETYSSWLLVLFWLVYVIIYIIVQLNRGLEWVLLKLLRAERK